MPPPDHTVVPVGQFEDATERELLSRRSLLRGAAGAGAAGLALTTLAASPALAASRPSADADLAPDHVADGEAIVAHVRSVGSGEIDVYRGTAHVRVLDRALAAKLARASQNRGGKA
jgi:hypothetical protein